MKTSTEIDDQIVYKKDLDKVVLHYLNTETNFCLLIRGGWGTGKTFYLNHRIISLVECTPVFKDHSKKYKFIYVSLFGVSSIEEIQSLMLLELLPFLKSKNVHIGKFLAKATIKGIMYYKGMGGIAKSVDEFEDILSGVAKDGFDLENLVVCFDDFERKSDNLSTEQFIGYVNSLVEHRNTKVFLISNDEKFEDKDVFHKYKEYKEKIIGNSIDFRVDINNVFENIVAERFTGSMEYQSFLISQRNIFNTYFFEHSHNLRTLIFCLSYFHRVYSELRLLYDQEKNLRSISQVVESKLLIFAIAISIEYREHLVDGVKSLSSGNTHGIDNPMKFYMREALSEVGMFGSNNETKSKANDLEFKEKFVNKYFGKAGYSFYNSVYQHLTGGKIVDGNELYQEISQVFKNLLNPNKKLELLSKVTTSECLDMDDTEYANSIKEIIEYAKNGEYPISEYLTIYFNALKFGNPCGYDPDKLKCDLKKGLEKINSTENDGVYLKTYLDIPEDAAHRLQLEDLKTQILERNNSIRIEEARASWDELEDLCYRDFKNFKQKVLFDRKYMGKPLFSVFDSERFFSFIDTAAPSIRKDVLFFFRDEYVKTAPNDWSLQIKFFQDLEKLVRIKDEALDGNNISGQQFRWLLKVLQDIVKYRS